MHIEPGTRLGRYEVREKIGAGGMGVVYLAHDATLRRPVALKVLPADLTRNEDRLRRFEQEAFAASALNHPHILTVYEIGAQGDARFIATELVEGVTLRKHAAGRRLPPRELLDIATQIASALVAAHDAGIVHRDIKPENVMLRTDGYVKVVDFGLAKLTRPPAPVGGDDVEALTRRLVETQPGVVMGTVAYMSPEQARGLEVDARTDLWSLGAVLYELAAGRPPFTGATPSDVMAAVLTAEPPPLKERVFGVSEGLLEILRRALEKEPAARYQTAAEMLEDLRRLKRRVEAESEFTETRAHDSRAADAQRAPGANAPADGSATRDAGGSQPDRGLGQTVEIAHVLFADIVGYSRLPMDEQGRVLRRLQEIVRGTREYRRARESDQLISLPTGDGMALVFFGDPEAPALCAIEISRALREQPPMMGLRMGVHTGPVYRVDDINASRNVAGGGINTAQRVMDCGDAGHILVSSSSAEVLGQLSGWQGKLHDLGEAEVKHGVRVRVFNLCADGAGNPDLPQKLRAHKPAEVGRGAGGGAGAKWLAAGLALLLAGAAVVLGAAYWYVKRGGEPATNTTVATNGEASMAQLGKETPAASVNPVTPEGLAALIEGAGGEGGATPAPASPPPAGGASLDSLAGMWAGTYGPMSQRATLHIEDARGGRIRGVLEQGGVRVAFEGSADARSRAVTFKETRVLSGDGWSLGECKGQLSSDGRMMSGTGQDPFGAQLGMTYQWSFTKQ